MSGAAARNPRTTLVVPCYNEAARLPTEAFGGFAAERDWLRFLFVDDGSSDGTRAVLEGLVREQPDRLGLLGFDANRGKAEAVRRGVLEALGAAPDLVGFWDADLATPLAELDRFVGYFQAHPELEILFGSRVLLLGRDIRRHTGRHYFGRLAATAVSFLLHVAVYDTQCGAKLFRATDAVQEIFAEPFLTRWIFDVEILARWLAGRGEEGRREIARFVHEVPLEAWEDVAGSRLRLRDFVRAPLDLWRIRRHYRP